MGGDFNCIEDPILDKRSSAHNPSLGTQGYPELATLSTLLGLEDWWRITHPDQFQATWTNGSTSSRIDRWLTPVTPLKKEITTLIPTKSDHLALLLKMEPPNITRGKGYWKFNSSLLHDPLYIEQIEYLLNYLKDESHEFNSRKQYWDYIKSSLREWTIGFTKFTTQDRNKKKANILNALAQADIDLQSGINVSEERKTILEELKVIEQQEMEGVIARNHFLRSLNSKIPHASLSRLQNSRSPTLITSLLTPDNEIVKEPHQILNVARNYYEKLYSSDDANVDAEQKKILSSWSQRISPNQFLQLNQPLSEDDLTSALWKMRKNISPGPDGLGPAFYQQFWDQLKGPFMDMINEIEETSQLTPSQERGLITLLFKKGDPENLDNYRPITLLNTDQKIMSSVIAARLSNVSNSLIHPDQTGIKGRFIGTNLRLMKDITYLLDNKKMKGAVILLDQMKAFDRVRWSFMHKILDLAGFPPRIKHWVQILYKSPKNSLLINGHISAPFQLKRGVRQGDPLSPILFAFTIEALACAIRESNKFEGMELPNSKNKIKISLYADDLALFASSTSDILEFRQIYSTYSAASDAKINEKKTEGLLYLPYTPPKEILDCSWQPKGTPVRYLGVMIGKKITLQQSWSAAIVDVSNSIQGWSSFPLPMKTRSIIIKHYIFPKLLYRLAVEALDQSSKRQIDKMLRGFLWKSTRGKIRKNILTNLPKDGGLSFPDLDSQANLSALKWTKRLLALWTDTPDSPYAQTSKFLISNAGSKWGQGRQIFHTTAPLQAGNLAPKFYLDCIKIWRRLGEPAKPKSSTEILSQPIAFNPSLNIPLPDSAFERMASHGLVRVRDFFKNPEWMSPQDILTYNKWNCPPAWIESVIESVPLSWIRTLAQIPPLPPNKRFVDDEGEIWLTDEFSHLTHEDGLLDLSPTPASLRLLGPDNIPLDCSDFNPTFWKIGLLPLSMSTPKQLRLKCYIKSTVKAQALWEEAIQGRLKWKVIWRKVWSPIVPPQLNTTYYLLLHLAHTTGEKADKKGFPPINLLCSCGSIESAQHLFWNCKFAQARWKTLWTFWRANRQIPPAYNLKSILSPPTNPTFLILHRTTLHHIWVERCGEVYGQKPRTSAPSPSLIAALAAALKATQR